MALKCFNEGDSVLLLGEGNFTFSIALFQTLPNINITATCFEAIIDNMAVKKNIEYLLDNDVEVLLGVDATKLSEYPALKSRSFDKVIFNFPHVGGKMRIEKNRDLLQRFFINAEMFIKFNGSVLVTLCNGQGGIPLDKPLRRWDDSWKIVEMAAYGNFTLRNVEPFLWSMFKNYVVTGYRSLDKTFCTSGALTYFFKNTEPPGLQNIAPTKKIKIPLNAPRKEWKDLPACIDKMYFGLSLYPPSFTFDITFSIGNEFNDNTFYEILYNHAAHIIEDVEFIDVYVSPSTKTITRTYRITYKSYLLPLYRKRVIEIHENTISNVLEKNLNIRVSR